MKNITIFHKKIIVFTAVKNGSILHNAVTILFDQKIPKVGFLATRLIYDVIIG